MRYGIDGTWSQKLGYTLEQLWEDRVHHKQENDHVI